MKWIVRLEKAGGSYRITVPKAVIESRKMLADRYVVINDDEQLYVKIERLDDLAYKKNR